MSRRRRRQRRQGRDAYREVSRQHRTFKRRSNGGWGMNLYRNPNDGVIAGVAAGLADHWGTAAWVIRLLWVAAFLFTGTLAFWLYVAGWILMARRPSREGVVEGVEPELEYEDVEVEMEYDERQHDYRPRKVFRYSESSSIRLQRARERLDAALARVESMESYVTSRQYNLNKEFSKL